MTVFDSLAAVALILFCGWVVIHSARIAWHDWGPSAVWLVAAFAMAALGLAALPDSLAEVCFWSAGGCIVVSWLSSTLIHHAAAVAVL